ATGVWNIPGARSTPATDEDRSDFSKTYSALRLGSHQGQVHNLEVSRTHLYLAGKNPIVSHNTSSRGASRRKVVSEDRGDHFYIVPGFGRDFSILNAIAWFLLDDILVIHPKDSPQDSQGSYDSREKILTLSNEAFRSGKLTKSDLRALTAAS